MLDSEPTGSAVERAADGQGGEAADDTTESKQPKKATRRRAPRKAAAEPSESVDATGGPSGTDGDPAGGRAAGSGDTLSGDGGEGAPTTASATKPTRTRRKKAAAPAAGGHTDAGGDTDAGGGTDAPPAEVAAGAEHAGARAPSVAAPLFLAPDPPPAGAEPAAGEDSTSRRRRPRRSAETADAAGGEAAGDPADSAGAAAPAAAATSDDDASGGSDGDATQSESQRSRRRGRRGRGRGKGATADQAAADDTADADDAAATDDAAEEADASDAAEEVTGEETDTDAVKRRRRRRRRKGSAESESDADDDVPTVVKVRDPRTSGDEVRGVTGSTRLEAKRQRRRGGRDQRRTRPSVLSESEFLARREAVDRVMVIREHPGRTQIGVLEDGVLVEHYVTRATGSSVAGSVYLGKVQNVLPSMEAAFVDVGRGRNAVLYAGEVNWDVAGLEGKSRSIEQALKSGDSVMVQVTKDPVGNKGARLTSSIALSGRHLVYVPHGNASGISRKLPDTERRRLRNALKSLVPEGAGVIVRTAAEGASEEDLARDVKRLQAQWEEIQAKAAEVSAPASLYTEPDLVVRVVRDLFNEDFRELVIEGDTAYGTVEAYLSHVSPDLVGRLRRHTGTTDVFATHRIEEQILKGLDRKVYLPSGGHLVIDRTEAMTVIDVNTGKYTGTGGNLEETVTRNNLEAAEEIVRQLRLRDIGGIIVIDFIDMVLESNRDLVLRRLTECLGRDRTKHQVTEITSLGLVQMTRKRVGAGLLEVFSETCECCKGRGVVVNLDPAPAPAKGRDAAARVKAVASASTSGGRERKSGSGGSRGRRGARDANGGSGDSDAGDQDGPGEVAGTGSAGPATDNPPAAPPAADPPAAEAGGDGGAPGGEPEPDLPVLEQDTLGVSGMLRRFRRGGGRRRSRP